MTDGDKTLSGGTTIGVLSDSHGCLPPTAEEALQGVDLIVHAGDIDRPGILEALERLAPVCAVRGNMDGGPWASGLEEVRHLRAAAGRIRVQHDLSRLDIDPSADGIGLVISGHTHRPSAAWKKGVLYLNPGSVCFPRAGHPSTLVRISLRGGRFDYRFLDISG